MPSLRRGDFGRIAAWLRRGGWLPAGVAIATILFVLVMGRVGISAPAVVPAILTIVIFAGLAVCWLRVILQAPADPAMIPARWLATVAVLANSLGVIVPVAVQFLAPGQPPPMLFAAMGFFQGPLSVAAVLFWPAARRPRDAWGYFILDGAILALGTVLILWYYQFGPHPTAPKALSFHAETVTNAPLLVGVSVAILRGTKPEVRLPFYLLLVALGVTFFVNFGLGAIQLPETSQALVSVAFTAVVVLLWVGAGEALRLHWPWPAKTPTSANVSPIPMVAVMAVALLLLQLGFKEQRSGIVPIVLGAIGMTGLLLARQSLTMRHNVRLLAEKAAHEAEARIAALVRYISDVILVTDDQFKIRFISPSAAALWHGDPQRLIGADVRDLIDPLQRAELNQTLAERLKRPGQSMAVGWRVAAQDGSWRRVEAVISNLLHEPSIGGVLMTLRDHTERAALEEQLHQAQKMEAVGQLAGGIAHDFNNLLTTILGHSEMGLESLDGKNPVRDDLAQVKRAAELAAGLTKQLLAFSRKQVIEARVIDVAATIEQIGKLLTRLIEENVRTVFEVAPDMGQVKMDPSQLEQVVLNLAINARDAMPNGGTLKIVARRQNVSAEIQGTISVPPGDYLVVEVSDTGIGMDEATMSRIFEPFFTTKPPGRGTGLGLASVYGIITQNKGGLLLRSAPGKGSTFSVFLPRVEADAALPIDASAPPSVTKSTATILLVEDETALRDIANKVLTREGYDVVVASDALQARVLADEMSRIDLLLTDVVMPGLSGPRLAAQLRNERPGLRVLFMSGHPGNEFAAEMGPNDRFLPKPFAPHAMLESVRAALANGQRASRSAD